MFFRLSPFTSNSAFSSHDAMPKSAVHRRRGREVLLSLFALLRAEGELAEAEVAVGDVGFGSLRELIGAKIKGRTRVLVRVPSFG